MALAALCGDDDWGRTWEKVVQHRFAGDGEMRGHVVGNLLIVSLWELLGDHVQALDWVGRLLGASGRVLPMALTPMDITAAGARARSRRPDCAVDGARPGGGRATTEARSSRYSWTRPTRPPAPRPSTAVRAADWVVLGPGSWFTSVIPHLMVPDLRAALGETDARLVIVLNLEAEHGRDRRLRARRTTSPRCSSTRRSSRSTPCWWTGVALPTSTSWSRPWPRTARTWSLADVARGDGTPRHDPVKLADAFDGIFTRG